VSVGKCSKNWLLVLSNPNPHTGGFPQAPSETLREYNPLPLKKVINQMLTRGMWTGLFILFRVGWLGLPDMFGSCDYFGFIDCGNFGCMGSNISTHKARVLEIV
jgi:hypothetical protein